MNYKESINLNYKMVKFTLRLKNGCLFREMGEGKHNITSMHNAETYDLEIVYYDIKNRS